MASSIASAKAALAEFMDAWNRADIEAVRATLNFPHITLGPQGQLIIANEPSEFQTDFARMRQQEGWHRSMFDEYSWMAESPNKVHCEVVFHRYREDGTSYGSGRVLYAITNHNGHWGMQLRSGMPDANLASAATHSARGT
jgi:hypothetical protein